MKHGTLVALFVATAFAAASAQPNTFPNFPYCGCTKTPSPYSVDPTYKSFNNGTYCFTIRAVPLLGCKGYCCRADLKKMEFNVAKECDVFAAQVKATVNGKFTKVGPAFDAAKDGPAGATILRLTQLGLNLDNADGTEICITLGTSRPGRGCTTLEDLCSTSLGGSTPGTCSIALFDSQNDCCPLSYPSTFKPPPPPSPPPPSPPPPPPPSPPPPPPPSPPPPPPPSPPPPPPPSPPPPPPPSPPPPPPPSPPPPPPPHPPPPSPPPPSTKPCKICAYLVLTPNDPIFPVTILEDQCQAWAEAVASDVYNQAEAQGIEMVDAPPEVSCTNLTVKVCGTFKDETAAVALQSWIDTQILFWLQLVTIQTTSCPAYLNNHNVAVYMGGDGSPDSVPGSCLEARASLACKPEDKIDFPKCVCNTRKLATPFAAYPVTYKIASPRNTKASLYCFTLTVKEPYAPDSPCGRTDTLLKSEMWMDDSKRRKVYGVGVQASNEPAFTWLASTWGAIGEDTFKATPLRWSKAQAEGARICVEIDNSVTLRDICMTNSDTCWINFFDNSKSCCPLWDASLI